jgi:hypothetical protein
LWVSLAWVALVTCDFAAGVDASAAAADAAKNEPPTEEVITGEAAPGHIMVSQFRRRSACYCLAGVLWKKGEQGTAGANAYQQRFVVLANGFLSYYKNQVRAFA